MSKIEQLHEFLKENPDDSFLRFALALEFIKAVNYDEALKLFKLLVEQDPDYLATYLHYGNLLGATGNTSMAEKIYAQGIAVAKAQSKIKARQELEQALFLLD